MARGRCAGCGAEGPSRKIASHILDCPDWQALYQSSPSTALAPEPAYAAWQAEGHAAARSRQRAHAVQEQAQRRLTQDSRFARLPDPLE